MLPIQPHYLVQSRSGAAQLGCAAEALGGGSGGASGARGVSEASLQQKLPQWFVLGGKHVPPERTGAAQRCQVALSYQVGGDQRCCALGQAVHGFTSRGGTIGL